MNVDQCKWRKKMMGRGVDGGCGAEEKPCRPIRKANLDKGDVKKEVGIDFLAQASKNLSERSPFDVAEDGSTLVPSVVPSLPVALANLLNQSDNHKRKHKKSAHSGAEKKKKKSFREKLRSGSIWVEHADYFRRLELPDLETLSDLASLRSLSCGNCLSVPESVGIQQRETDATAKNEDALEEIKNFLSKEIVKEEEDVGEPMNVDNVKVEESVSSGSLEWVLGCRNRILLTSERPSKKRKLLGGDAGLGKLMVATPCEGNGLLCDFCCTGEAKEQNHQLIVCHSCKATVHRKCYGVLKDTDKLWLCSWCKLENGRSDSERPCLLCPKKGGIMKPVLSKTENGGSTEFAHLFCSMWMPEVYIEDLKKMEPILNVPAIKETRRKLLCNLCKVKSGACIRCCNGTCRTSFHPLCAREAGNRLEVWGTHGCDTVELRAFCSKHSDIRESGRSIQGRESNAGDSHSPVCHLPSESVREGHPSNDEIGVDAGTPGTGSDISRNSELRDIESPHSKFNCSATDNVESGMSRRSNDKEITMSKSGLPLLLKKFIDMGKVDVKEVAAEFGVNPDALSAKLTDGDLLPDLLGKVIKWVSQNTHMGNGNKDQNLKSKNTTKSKPREAICTEGMEMLDSDILDPTVTKAFPLKRTLESNNCNNKQDNMTCSSAELFTGNGIVVDEAKIDKPVLKKEGSVNLASDHSPQEQKSIVLDREVHLGNSSVHLSDDHGEQSNSNSSGVMLENAFPSGPNGSQNCGNLNFLSPIILDLLNHEAYPGCSPHPYILKELSKMGKGKTLKSTMDSDVDRMTTKTDGSEEGNGHLQGAGDHTTCCNHQSKSADCGDTFCQICKARKLGILGLSPEDEVEGELLYYQLQLLGTAVSRKHLSDNLVYEVAKKLPLEIDEQHGRRWDDVLVKKYFHDVREARKQGRKEQRHKQAQAVLAAATAAAATSSRNTSLRKDMSEEPGQQEMSTSRRKVGSSHPVPQTKETLLKAAVSLPPSDKRSDNRAPDFSVENPRTCDICRRSETIWNLIVVCSSCKVAVHMDCYKCAKESTGPWYCELCAESSSGPSNIWEQPYSSTECAICGGTTGAFRKATNGQWIHAFCAEWSLESTFRRGQINPVQGMESLAKNMDTCCVCQRKYGSCSKCSYGNCQSTFHPSCARSVGFHMTGGGKLPHKAYCEKHSLEQKAKAESQKYGAEEQKTLKHYRVELERLRLLCERIVKREKLKRELAISSHEILAAKRDHAARSLHVRNPFSLSEVSSDSATTSIKGHPDSNISGSEARQRSDDITIDSTASVKLRGKGPILPDTDQKTDDSATSKGRVSRKQTERQILSGKTVPRKHCIVSPSVSEDGDGSKPKKHVETFAKELVMTSDEASFKNRRLPKGYFYVPVDRLQEDKPDNQKTASSGKPTNQKSSSSGDQSGKDG